MSTEILNRIKSDRLLSTKAGNEKLKSYLGVLLGEIDRNRGTSELDDTVVAQCIKKMRSAAKENMSYPSSDKAEFQFQLDVLNTYIKEEITMTEDETRKIIIDMIAGGASNIGAIMKGIASVTSIPVDKSVASKIAMELLKK